MMSRDFWLAVRQALLMIVDALERGGALFVGMGIGVRQEAGWDS
jgi:hypothetical protein